MNARHIELSDCWSLEQQPAPYYRIAAAQARKLQADATTPRVKQYFDKMIAHCEGVAGNVEPGVSQGSARRYADRSGMAKNHDRLQPRLPRARAVVVRSQDWMIVGRAPPD